MTLFRYSAVPVAGGAPQEGEAQGETAADIRARLRGAGMQVISIKPVRESVAGAQGPLARRWAQHLRSRRGAVRAEIYDGISTMIASGSSLTDAIAVLAESQPARSSARTLLLQLKEALNSGRSTSFAMRQQPQWFDGVEASMVAAGEQAGTLEDVLRSLAEREQRSNELSQKLTGALLYPAIIATVGLGAVLFLSVKTLPELTKVLQEADVETPALTSRVMWFGQLLAEHALLWLGLLFALFAVAIFLPALLKKSSRAQEIRERLIPDVVRKLALSAFSARLALMIRSGVSVVDALRTLAPTAGHQGLQASIVEAASRVERGEDLAAAMTNGRWFDPEFRRLLEVGQQTGELDSLLERLAERYERKAARLIDRLTTVLEPAVILVLSVLIGIVVMAAVLPMIRLQEVFA